MKGSRELIYLDNAATSFPKPEGVWQAMERCLFEVGGNPGRSGHRLSWEAAQLVYDARESLAHLFNIENSARVIFTKNATEAINLALFGYLQQGDRVVTTSMEHNAVMRPLRYLERMRGIEVRVVDADAEGMVDIVALARAMEKGSKLLVVNHASNVSGTLVPLEAIGKLAREFGISLLVDAAQTAGCVPIDVNSMGISLLAFTGHKGLLGPQGTGGLYISPEIELEPLILGGTGSNSEREEQPSFLPDKHESGTLNAVGLAGLSAGVNYVMKWGVKWIRSHEERLFLRFWHRARDLPYLTLYGPGEWNNRVAVVSFNMERKSPSEVGYTLDKKFGIMARTGLHCAPSAHRTLGTFPQGTVRVAFGPFNREEEVDMLLEALEYIGGERTSSDKTGRR